MTPDEIADTISRIQHHLDTAADLMLELHTSKAHETLGITEAQLAWRIFGRPELKPNSAYKRFYRAWRTAEMQAQISDMIAQDSDGHMSYLDPAMLSGTACEALHKVEHAARLEVLNAAYRDNGGSITVKAIAEAAEAIAEYGVFAVLPDGAGGQVKASEAISDLLYMQARNERRMDSKRVYLVNNLAFDVIEIEDDELHLFLFDRAHLELPAIPDRVKLRAAVWYELD